MTKKKKILISLSIILLLAIPGAFLFLKLKQVDTKQMIVGSLSAFEKIVHFLPIKEDTKKEIETINALSEYFTKNDNVERRILVLLQNNMELRPGGGFLGQYAVLKIMNGQVTSTFVEDANLLDQRITADVNPPYPFERMMQIKKWKFRDSNFSPDFPTNVDKAEYFYRLAGNNSDFDAVVAVNASVLNRVLELTGPITVPGYNVTFNSQDASIKLEDYVERAYLNNPELDTRYRKNILKSMADVIIEKLMNLRSIPKIADFTLNELRNKDVMLNFKDSNLQSLAQQVHWDGAVSTDWGSDYLMLVDANMGALKSDYYIKRTITYDVDLTAEKPTVTLNIDYQHTATYGDWRTSDYHSYLRVYVPKGSNLLERKMVSYPNIQEEFGKTYFGFIVHVLINRETHAVIKYELPDWVKNDYKLLIQKQSGVGDVPVTVHVKSDKGEFTQQETLKKDLKFEFNEDNQ